MTLICKFAKVQVRAFSFFDAHQPLARIPVLTTFHRHREPFEPGATLFEPPQTTYSRSNDISPHSELQSLTQRPTQHHPAPYPAPPSTTQRAPHLAPPRFARRTQNRTQNCSQNRSRHLPDKCLAHSGARPSTLNSPKGRLINCDRRITIPITSRRDGPELFCRHPSGSLE